MISKTSRRSSRMPPATGRTARIESSATSLSPPIDRNVGDSGFTKDWAVVKVDPSKIDSTNFVGNVIDLGIDIPVNEFTSWMYPQPANPPSFDYPGDRFHKFSGFIPDEDIWKLNSKTRDHDNDPVIMVVKRGHASGLTVGRLNTIRSFTRYYLEDEVGILSKEVAVLSRNSKLGPFSSMARAELPAYSQLVLESATAPTAPMSPQSTFFASAWQSMASRPTSSPPSLPKHHCIGKNTLLIRDNCM